MLTIGTCKSQNYFLVEAATTADLVRALESGMFVITLCVVRSISLINVAVYLKVHDDDDHHHHHSTVVLSCQTVNFSGLLPLGFYAKLP